MVAIVMLIMAFTAITILSDIWFEDDSETTNQERTVTMLIRESSDTLGLDRMIKKIYVEEKIRVDLQVIPDNQMDSLVRMKVNSGEIPDILDYDIPNAYGLINPEMYLEDLSDETWVERLTSTEYVEYADGNIYALPLQESSGLGGIIYNKAVFAELGLSIPTTEEEFYELCQTLLEANITPILMSSEFAIPQMWIEYGISLALGSEESCLEVVEVLEKQEGLLGDYEEIVEVLDCYLGLFEKNFVNTDFQIINYSELCQRIGDGTGAMMLGNYDHVTEIEYLNQEVELGIFPIPFDYNEDLQYITTESAKGLVVFKDGNNTEVALEVLEFWSKPEYLALWYMDYGSISSFEDVESGPMNTELLVLYEDYIENEPEINEFNTYALSFYNLITTKFWLYYMEAPMNGESSWDILEKCQWDIDVYME